MIDRERPCPRTALKGAFGARGADCALPLEEVSATLSDNVGLCPRCSDKSFTVLFAAGGSAVVATLCAIEDALLCATDGA